MSKLAYTPSHQILLWILASLSLVVLPHINRLPLWVGLGFISLVLWRYANLRWRLSLPNRWLRMAMAVLAMIGVLSTFHTVTGRDAGVALLVILTGLKLLEMRSVREALLLVFLSYFLIITNFLYSQSIVTALYLCLVMLVSTATLISISDQNHQLSIPARLRYASSLILQSLPMMLVLFILFPRIEGSFWKLPDDAHASRVTGISDTMSLGSIGRLSLSDRVAFRVLFDGHIPPPSQRYWRGLVFNQTDGKTWQQGYRNNDQNALLQPIGEPVRYTITLEPHQQAWLYSLDLPTAAPSNLGTLMADYHIRTDNAVNALKRYSMVSYPYYRTQFASKIQADRQLSRALRLPMHKHPQARLLAQTWQLDNPDPKSIMKKALAYFAEQPFYYTLDAPPLRGDPIDEFLFKTRAGFCEHYAAAFVTLMRAASVPARIVVGYQGGSLNPFGDYLIVRQRDAHAWTEVWLAGQGWIRVDPTAEVSPSRVEAGIDSVIPEIFTPLRMHLSNYAWVQQLRYAWDAANNHWNQWVLGYGPRHQKDLLKWLGLDTGGYQMLTTILIASCATLLLAVAFWLFLSQQKQKPDQVVRLYQRFCDRLAGCGLQRLPHEGSMAFAQRAAQALPAQAVQIHFISRLYTHLRYRITGSPSTQKVGALARAVRCFKPKKTAHNNELKSK